MIVYKILKNRYFGGKLYIPDNEKGIPPYTTRTAVPDIPDNMFAIWNGRGWSITKIPPQLTPLEPKIKTIISIDHLFDKFNSDKWNILTNQDPLIKAFILDCSVRNTVDITDPNFQTIINYMIENFNYDIDMSLII